ncbi:MAG: exosortase system-associated protein, TIGR04073 family [Betaproteobacteria bacterium]|nr:exosortase system-associated protein, TIGR04073 family [Betaproteobacteria bacterium]
MRKNNILAACILICFFMMTSPVKAESYFIDKLSQGAANVAFGFIEIPKNIINITNDQNILVGLTWGLIRGVIQGVSRTLVGGMEVITSPIPTSEFASPAYVWDRFSEDSRYFGLHYPGYWTNYGPLDDGE